MIWIKNTIVDTDNFLIDSSRIKIYLDNNKYIIWIKYQDG